MQSGLLIKFADDLMHVVSFMYYLFLFLVPYIVILSGEAAKQITNTIYRI